ncbi:MAG: aspartate aminotransferase family protein [Myxococcales bacterium]|nr:aspartate aminotransferase family protein [Myxococcales bacterium]MCB9575677.1 aspartate aminotransferase family protein [Polyangiaceae bacterium]
MKIPETGAARESVLSKLSTYRQNDIDWRSGRTFAYIFDAGREAESVCKEAYMSFLSENALDPTVYPSLMRLENELVGMAAHHLGGNENTVGTFTSGGTESIILAVKATRDRARKLHPEIKKPQIVIPVTAHAAFHKAAHYLDLEVVLVDVDPETFRAIPEAVAKAITDQTILIVGSAPSYAHGVIDPIEELGRIALEKKVAFHVDACIGGFLLPYFRRLGDDVPPFELNVPGVTSISMDFHKYAYAAKGASVVLYNDPSFRQAQFFTCADWTGYTLINASIQSTKSGGPLAGAWAVLNYLGDEGYLEIARGLQSATRELVAGIEGIEGLKILGNPSMSLLAIGSDSVNLFHVVDEMKLRGWYVQAQLSYGKYPTNIHLSVHPGNVSGVKDFLIAFRDSVEAARKLPSRVLLDQLGPMLSELPKQLDTLGPEGFAALTSAVGAEGMKLPERMAGINELLDALPPAARGKLMTAFLDQMFQSEF